MASKSFKATGKPVQLPSGAWRARWWDEHGKRRSETIDKYDDAELKLRREQVRVEEVRRGLRGVAPVDHKFGELCDRWIEVRVPHKRSGKTDASFIRAHLRPALGEMLLREITPATGDVYRAERAHLGKKTIHSHITLIVSMLRFAAELGWLQKVPRLRKPKVRAVQSDFRYLRTLDEIRRLLIAAKAEGEEVFALYATAIYTGMRAGELAGLRWDAVDLKARLIAVQRSYDGPTKAEDVRQIPILDPLLPILREWRLRRPGALVFPNRADGMRQKSDRIFQETLHKVLEAAGFPMLERDGKKIRYITFHSLRHSFASLWMMNGGDLFRLQRLLGHKSDEMTQRYAHLAPSAFTADYARLGSIALAEAQVVPISGTV